MLRLSLPRLIGRIERALVRKYEFIRNVAYYYIERKHQWRVAVSMAKDTL